MNALTKHVQRLLPKDEHPADLAVTLGKFSIEQSMWHKGKWQAKITFHIHDGLTYIIAEGLHQDPKQATLIAIQNAEAIQAHFPRAQG